MKKKIIALGLIIACIGTNVSVCAKSFSTPQTKDYIISENTCSNQKESIVTNNSIIFKSETSSNMNYNVRAVMGQQSWSSFAWSVTMEAAGYLPAGKFQQLYDKIYLVITKGVQLGTKDWESLCWTVVDVVCAFIPGAVPAKVFWSICKLTPSF